MTKRWTLLLAGFCLVSALFARGEEKSLASGALLEALESEISGEIAYRYTVELARFDRIQATEGWHAAAVRIQDALKSFGYEDVQIEGWPSNGSRYYYTYQTPIGWRARSAELWMVSPAKERLCSSAEIPLTLVKHSGAASDVEARLVDVGTGLGDESYRDKDVQGRIVLATGYTGEVMREAVIRRGALGVVTWYPPEVRPGYPEMIRYTAVWPRWEEREKVGFGFNVSKIQGWRLKNLLAEGREVVLKASVDAEFYDSRIEVLTAALPGTDEPEREVLIIGHLCHPAPSANDNASGSAGMLEMARALKRMVDKGSVEPPKRTIRFLWVPEFYGTVPYIQAHLQRTRNTLAVINCDMIGEDLHLTGGTFNVTCTPDSNPSYLNDVVVNFTRAVDDLNLVSPSGSRHPFAYRIRPFSGGSDHYIFNDGALKVPAVMFGHGDTFHHTSLDTPDKVDASELRRVSCIALGASYYVATADDGEALDMARLIVRNGTGRIAADYYDGLQGLYAVRNPRQLAVKFDEVRNVLDHAVLRESQALLSTRTFIDRPDAQAEVAALGGILTDVSDRFGQDLNRVYGNLCRDLGLEPEKPEANPEESAMSRVVPQRSEDFVCPLQASYLIDKLGPEAMSSNRLQGLVSYEALNFVDGHRSVTEIARAVSAEFGPVPVGHIYDFLKILEKAGLLAFHERN